VVQERGAGPACGVCRQPVTPGVDKACGLCAAPHHPDCWEYTGACSTFGCGGIAAVPWVADLVPRNALTIDETTAVDRPGRGPAALLRARLGGRVKDLPVTLKAGLRGGLAATATLAVFVAAAVQGPWILLMPIFWKYMAGACSLLVGTGGIYGLAAPFLAPLQHRYPLRTGLVAALASVVCFFGLGGISGDFLFFVATLLTGMAAASSLAEWLAGPYRRLGRKLGAWAAPVRYGLTGLVFFVCSVVAHLIGGLPTDSGSLAIITIFTVLAALTAGHSLEAGREEYRKHLIALVEGPGHEGPPGEPGA
jgi:hypothetical protein